MIFAKRELEKAGFFVDTLALFGGEDGNITDADLLLLPVPATRDKVNINCANSGIILPLGILNNLPPHIKVFGGGHLSIDNYTDYLSLDSYAIKNSVLTAEGAISYAIDNTDFSLWKSRILIIGYGRLGRVLTDRLRAFSPTLTVSARSGKDISTLQALGINYIKTDEIQDLYDRFDIVFNTVDIKLSDKEAKRLEGSLFLDLSSKGGFLNCEAVNFGIEYVKLPSIPAKSAPETAGKIIAETVIELLG